MPCDGKNPNCDRRRELLAQLKCLISSMDKKKPCEWDEPSSAPIVCCPAEVSSCTPPCSMPLKPSKSFNFRTSIMYKCECIRRNGLQDRCMMWDCMGRPECMTKLYPVCEPGRAALLKLTDLGDAEVALRKFQCIDQAREAALAAYCKLMCDNAQRKRALPCDNQDVEAFARANCSRSYASNDNLDKDTLCKPAPCNDSSSATLYKVYAPSPALPTCCIIPSCCMSYPSPKEMKQSYEPPPMCLPCCPSPICPPPNYPPPICPLPCLPCVQCCPAI